MIVWHADRAVARAAHHADRNGGDEFTFRLLSALRGDLLHVSSSDREVWVVAARNGDDTVLALFNDATVAKTVQLALPTGANATSIERSVVQTKADKQGIELVKAAGDAAALTNLSLEPRTATVLRIGGLQMGKQAVTVTQHVAKEVLLRIAPGATATVSIALPDAERNAANLAWLRLALEANDGKGTATVAGQTLALGGEPYLVRLPLDAKSLTAEATVTFTAGPGGLGVNAASIELVDLP